MELDNIKKVVAFDFDDTLAETNSLIGVRFDNDDHDFEKFLFDNNIQFVEFDSGFWWLDSANYALAEDAPLPEDASMEADYAQTMHIDMSTLKVISPMLAKMSESLQEPGTLTLVITARAGNASTFSPSLGREVKARNRQQIMSFLDDQGLSIPASNLHTVGDGGGDTAQAKAKVLSSYLTQYSPEELIFYDDSDRNVRQVAQLCKGNSPHVKISAYKVANGVPTNRQGCDHKKGLKDRLSEILRRITE
jgi:hypothetical protein